uniref:Uncharacterized protein n=1 Tax=Physcomitrium patens TaxID=3218 RepID=A0A2K1LAB7_PHYPA|nr:hypothetical protein PHYPA_001393 [Physcomitrium patens]
MSFYFLKVDRGDVFERPSALKNGRQRREPVIPSPPINSGKAENFSVKKPAHLKGVQSRLRNLSAAIKAKKQTLQVIAQTLSKEEIAGLRIDFKGFILATTQVNKTEERSPLFHTFHHFDRDKQWVQYHL